MFRPEAKSETRAAEVNVRDNRLAKPRIYPAKVVVDSDNLIGYLDNDSVANSGPRYNLEIASDRPSTRAWICLARC